MKFPRRKLAFCQANVLALSSTLPASTQANTPTNAAEEIGVPKLLPPYSELPPTFWQQHGFAIIVSGLVVMFLGGLLVWLIRRARPTVILPPAAQARRALESLRQTTEDGNVLSQVSRIVREYFRAAFNLTRDELTTTEFCQALLRQEKVGAEIAKKTCDFLRHCDECKFSALPAEPLHAADVALELVALGEAARVRSPASASILPAVTPGQDDETRRRDAVTPGP